MSNASNQSLVYSEDKSSDSNPKVTATSIQQKARIRGLMAKREISVIKKYCWIAELLKCLHLMLSMNSSSKGDDRKPLLPPRDNTSPKGEHLEDSSRSAAIKILLSGIARRLKHRGTLCGREGNILDGKRWRRDPNSLRRPGSPQSELSPKQTSHCFTLRAVIFAAALCCVQAAGLRSHPAATRVPRTWGEGRGCAWNKPRLPAALCSKRQSGGVGFLPPSADSPKNHFCTSPILEKLSSGTATHTLLREMPCRRAAARQAEAPRPGARFRAGAESQTPTALPGQKKQEQDLQTFTAAALW